MMVMMSSSSRCEDDAVRDKKKRFSEAQVRSMEVMFEAQAKLEPRKKQQLAKELGLHPRQVAIWFQNKRARWKSKELERAYAALSADYDALRSSFNSLLHQKNALSVQVQRLAEMLEKTLPEEKEGGDISIRGGKAGQKPLLSLSSHTISSDEEKKLKPPFEGEESENHLSKSKEQRGSRSLASADNDQQQQQVCFLNTGCPFDQLLPGGGGGGGGSLWWEFLSYE